MLFADQERARDLRSRQPTESPERRARSVPRARVAGWQAVKIEPQAVVRIGPRRIRLVRVAFARGRIFRASLLSGHRLLHPAQQLELPSQVLLAPEAIDRAISAHADDPGGRIGRHPLARPALEGDRERLLHRILGEVEVAEDADQGRDRAPGLPPEQRADVWRRRP